MKPEFFPSYKHLQKDIERLLKSEGKVEKNEHGQTVFHGYPGALEDMYRRYMNENAFAPLVAELRNWNSEWSYSEYLEELSERLNQAREWPLLESLWAGVIAKRRTNYNKTSKARRAVPDKVSEELVTKTRVLLLDSLYRLRTYASALHRESQVTGYLEMIARVEKHLRA